MAFLDFFRPRPAAEKEAKSLTAVDANTGGRGWFGIIREAWGGAFQQVLAIDAPKNILAFSAVFSSVTIIASDLAKLCLELVEETEEEIYKLVSSTSPYWQVLRKPNSYQTLFQFIENWIISKMLTGNAYVLKDRDARGIVVALYVLDPNRVTTLVTEEGSVYYQIGRDDLAQVKEQIAVPSSEIMHDRMSCLFHPLVGVSPIYACGVSATMGNRIQGNSTIFFENMSRPSGQLTSPTKIDDETAARLKKDFEDNFRGKNVGRVMVSGNGLKYEAMPGIPAQDAQLIEQLRWTVEDVARCFHVPMFKLGGPIPVGSTVETLQQTYYSDCLHALVQSFEEVMTEGLEMKASYCVKFDLDDLLRMDATAMIKAEGEAVQRGIKSPDEARKRFNLGSVPGGKNPYLQQQNFSLEALAKRDAKDDPFATATPARRATDGASVSDPAANQEREMIANLLKDVSERLRAPTPIVLNLPAPAEKEEVADEGVLFFMNTIVEGLRAASLTDVRGA